MVLRRGTVSVYVSGMARRYNPKASMTKEGKRLVNLVNAELAIEALGNDVPAHVLETLAWLRSQQNAKEIES